MICLDLFVVKFVLLMIYISQFSQRDVDTGKVRFHLNDMQGTCVSFEVNYAVSRVYVIEDIFEQYHNPKQSNTLFTEYKKNLCF